MPHPKLTVRLAVIAVGLMILAGAVLVSRDGSTSRDASSPGAGVPKQSGGVSGQAGDTAAGE